MCQRLRLRTSHEIDMKSTNSAELFRLFSGGLSSWGYVFGAWMIALAATLGAVFIGEVMGQAPCSLCWYQRTFMFPLAILLAVATYRSDTDVWRYALPLAAAGWAVAVWHMLLYAGVISEFM